MNTKELLNQRNRIKAKKPDFVMQDVHKKRRLHWKWRKSKGSDSKMRVSRRGYRRSVQIGWSSPAEVKGTNPQGLRPVIIYNAGMVDALNPKTDIAVIDASVGAKKRITIIEKALAKGIKIENYKSPEKFVQETKAKLDAKKKEKATLKEQREKKKEAAKKEAQKKKEKDEKKEKTEEKTEEEKKTDEKKEQDKLLITTQ
jgi:large subunit ribosomal protein L32e